MHPEFDNSEIMMDAMRVHPDWVHIENLSLNPHINTLVVVPCHAIFRGETITSAFDFDPTQIKFWSLNEFQDESELAMMIDHIRTGVITAAQIPESLLVFSGACTREVAGEWTEAESYYAVAEYYSWWENETGVPADKMRERAFAEVYALDSMENLTWSIRLFQLAHPNREVPYRVMVVGWGFKKKRFEMHAKELGIPQFEYVGLTDPLNFKDDEKAHKREVDIVETYKKDPLCRDKGSDLYKKKVKRNVKKIDYPYGSATDVKDAYKKQFNHRKATFHLL